MTDHNDNFFAKNFFKTREISGRSKVKPVEGLCDKHHRLWPSRSALTQNYVEGFQLFREDQIVLPLLMGEPPIGKEWMLLLIHHCQHDIKVRQSAEIIQTTGATRSTSIGASDKKILLVFRIMSSLLIATASFNWVERLKSRFWKVFQNHKSQSMISRIGKCQPG